MRQVRPPAQKAPCKLTPARQYPKENFPRLRPDSPVEFPAWLQTKLTHNALGYGDTVIGAYGRFHGYSVVEGEVQGKLGEGTGEAYDTFLIKIRAKPVSMMYNESRILSLSI